MTDRELLELAAKACRYEFNGTWFHEDSGLLVWEPPRSYESRDWNPLTDDGDALRLAVKLAINIEFYPASNTVFVEGIENGLLFDEFLGNDPCAATRHAIVIVAAEIGKQMKEQTP